MLQNNKPWILNIGCGTHKMPDACNLDISEAVNPDVCFDLENCASVPLPFSDNTFNAIHASHTLEHIRNILPLMQELYRVAKPGALLVGRVPYGSHDCAFEDPTHVRQFMLESPSYFSQAAYSKADYGYRGDWAVDKMFVCFPQEVFRQAGDMKNLKEMFYRLRNTATELIFECRAVKPLRQPLEAHKQDASVTQFIAEGDYRVNLNRT
jgi:SAM-dependent methyltransferase